MAFQLNTEPLARMVGEHARCVAVLEYMHAALLERLDLAGSINPDLAAVINTFLRSHQWMTTVVKLDRPTDFQAATAGVRAQLEMVIDLTLMNDNPSRYTVQKLLDWEESALLKQARVMEERSKNRKALPYVLDDFYKDTITNHGARIEQLRQKHWNSKDHPMRWTGARSLDADACIASKVSGGEDLHDLYKHIYAALCWATHGSGAIGFGRGESDAFPGWMWMAFEQSAALAIRVTRLALTYCQCFDGPAEAELANAQVEQQRRADAAYAEYMTDPTKGVTAVPSGAWPYSWPPAR